MIRHRAHRDAHHHDHDDDRYEDPLAIFEAPPDHDHDREKAVHFQVPECLQRCCNRRAARLWLFYIWFGIILIMASISFKMVRMIHTLSPADTILSVFFPTAWKFKKRKSRKKAKTILYYNNYWNSDHFQFGEHHRPFVEAGCPVHQCVAVQRRPDFTPEYLGSFDAILIHAAEIDLATMLTDIATWRQPHQRFIYMTMESPLSYNAPADHRLNDFFNWTMTYRLDSDLPRPYGFFELQLPGRMQVEQRYNPFQWKPQAFLTYKEDPWFQKVLPSKSKEFHQLAERPKKVAWIVSRCDSPSRREDYVKELQKYIPVDIFGGCGNIRCNTSFHSQQQQRNDNNDNCTATVERDYKFYLAFENSFCKDYITEKFFGRMQGNSLVVVLGGGNYTHIAPPHSHLNALDYESPKALAQKLHQLDQNKSLYLSYFWWKDYYRAHNGTAKDHASTMCKLCGMLQDEKRPSKSYPSIKSWHGQQCQSKLPKAVAQVSQRDVVEGGWDLLDD